jgi:hypothetical protein
VQLGERNRLVLADVGPLYASFDPSDQYHRQSHREFQALEANRRLIAVLWTTAAEGHSTVLRNLGACRAADWLENVTADALMLVP